ncbi:tyrosine-type recombinase/integrase [Massilia brevitalea]|uniref:tyrosine-type recombinase/integrase n=1 Tax=Massilia brevitalea TaxID=442526 RepID=UPI002739F2E2
MLGPVEDDWDAAEVWLRSVARKSQSRSNATVTTYRFHLAKLRWYCENVRRITPSRWSLQDVEAFKDFLTDLPADALCARSGKRYAGPGDAGYTPFRTQPAAGSRSDIERFVHALFKAWHGSGYIRINPMALEGAGDRRSINARRAVDVNLYELVLETMEEEEFDRPAARQINLRDRFILVALRELGLRASELVGSVMGAFQQIPDTKTKRHYWVFQVSALVAKGGKQRWVPVTQTLLKVLVDYRVAFGLPPQPEFEEGTALLLSPQTRAVKIAGKAVRGAADRRFFGAWQELTTRQYLYEIVKKRLKTTADMLRTTDPVLAVRLEQASPHWFRHTFAKAALLHGQSMREVANLLGHKSMDTTMVYTNQDALDSVRAFERDNIGVAREA